jgi:aminomethyltransferase
VTSGMYAPTLQCYLGMAYVPRALAKRETELEIMIRGKAVKAVVVKRPFYVPRVPPVMRLNHKGHKA